jgi:hypothetical protein
MISIIISAQNSDWQTKFEESDYLETVTYEECIAFSQKLAEASPMVHYWEMGESPQKRAIPLLIIDKDGFTEVQDIRKAGRLVLLVQAGIHAGEPDGTDAGFILIRDMIIDKIHLDLLEKVSILFIPSFNVDGLARMSPYNRINQNGPIEMGWRTNSNNLNLNRDYMKADSPEMRAWLKLFNKYLPDLFIDCHTTDGADYQYVATYALETFGNMDAGLSNWVKNTYEPYLVEEMNKKQSPIFPYVSFKNWHDPRSGLIRGVGTPMISQGYTALQNRVGLLIETHMLKAYKPRVFATYDLIIATLESMNQSAENLQALNSNADQLMKSNKKSPKELIIRYEVDMADTVKVDFLGVEYEIIKSDLTGGDWFQYSNKKTTFSLDLFEKQKAKEIVELPLAYIIPVEWQNVQEILKAHGIEFFIIDRKQNVDIESYQFANQKWSSSSFEGRQGLQSFDLIKSERKMEFEAGAMVIPVHQRALKVLVYLLEPKADNSLASWGFFNSIMERKEYAETYVMEKIAREMIAKNPDLLNEFEEWKKDNPEQAKSQWIQTMWFFEKTPYWDREKDVYPIGRIVSQEVLFELGMH